MKAAGVSTSRYCRVPDSAERLVLSKRSKKFFDFFRWKKSNIAFDLFDKTTRVIWSLVIWNFPNNERSIFYSYTLRVAIENIIDILKNINNESRWRIDISILQSSRLCRAACLVKRSKKFFDFSVGKNQTLLWSFWQDDKWVIWSLVIWNFPNNERSIFYSYTLRSYKKTLLFSRIYTELCRPLAYRHLDTDRVPDSAERLVLSKDQEVLWFFPLEKIKHCTDLFDKTTRGNLIFRYLEFSK